jgi:hypothetical protein
MKKLLMLLALAGLGFSMLGCAGDTKPPVAPPPTKTEPAPPSEPKPDATTPAPEEKK